MSMPGGDTRSLPELISALTSDLATLVPTHAVGHAVQVGPLLHEGGVLVDRPDLADVGGAADTKGCHTSSITVLPTCKRSPRRMTWGPCTFCRLRNVPLVDPRSSTKSCPSRAKTRACSCEA